MALALVAFLEQRLAFRLGVPEVLLENRGIGIFEIVAGIFLLGLKEDIAVGDAIVPFPAIEAQVEHAVDILHIHREPLEPVSDLARDRMAIEPADLLEISV